MYLQKLELVNFKNHRDTIISPDPAINVFVGRNGSGKTNILDAIHFLSITRSAFTSNEAQCILRGEQFMMIKGHFVKRDSVSEVVTSVQRGARKIFRENGAEYDKLSDHLGRYPIVMVAPDDTELVREGSESRRKFFDSIISQVDRNYLEHLIRYNQALKSRNAILKMFSETGRIDELALESYDRFLVSSGAYIYQRRKEFIDEFLPVFRKYYQFLVSQSEESSIRYFSGLHEVEFADGLKGARQRDLLLQRTNFGIHRDEFGFELGNEDLKRFGSQGQQKSFIISLKLAQYDIFERYKGFKPVILLDDVFDKLDDFRIQKLLELIKSGLGQLFITDARPDRTSHLLDAIGAGGLRLKVDSGMLVL